MEALNFTPDLSNEACALDRAGKYSEADDVLRTAGVPHETIESRRRHIEWRLKNRLPAIDGC